MICHFLLEVLCFLFPWHFISLIVERSSINILLCQVGEYISTLLTRARELQADELHGNQAGGGASGSSSFSGISHFENPSIFPIRLPPSLS